MTSPDLMDRARELPDYERIWLQPFAGDEGGHLWCSERIEDDDIEYVRKDVYEAALAAAEQRGAEREREALAKRYDEAAAEIDKQAVETLSVSEKLRLDALAARHREFAAGIRNRKDEA